MNRFNYHAVSRLATLFILVTVTTLTPAFAQSLNLAVIHSDGLFTMSVGEAVFAVDHLIRPVTVITEHLNQVSTLGGVVVPGTRLEAFINEEHHANIMLPVSGMPISCDGEGNCTEAGAIHPVDDHDHR